MNLNTAASIVMPGSREEVFDFACANETFERNLRPHGLIAGVEKAEMFEGQALAADSWRRISLTDGVVIEELILDYDRPTKHRYRWTGGLKAPNSWLVRSGEGCWDFSEVSGGTRIDWSYVFELTSPLAYPLALVARASYKSWMNHGLEAMRANFVG